MSAGSGGSSKANNAADLSGFPVIRLDQVAMVDTPTLSKAMEEVTDLMQSLTRESQRTGGGVPPMVHYLRKQNECMRMELAERSARDRIQQLLTGATDALHRSPYAAASSGNRIDGSSGTNFSAIGHGTAASPSTENSVSNSSENGTETKLNYSASQSKDSSGGFKPLPLPSELQRSNSTSAVPASSNTLTMNLRDMQTSRPVVSSEKMTSRSTDGDHRTSCSRPKRAFADSSDEGDAGGDADSDACSSTGAQSAPASAGRTERRPRQDQQKASRKSSGISFRKPQRHYLDIFNEKFGTSFVVPALNPRRRPPVAKKEPQLTEAERKEKERSDRRKAAMERLVKRKEERQKFQMKRKEEQRAKLQAKLKKERELREKEETAKVTVAPVNSSGKHSKPPAVRQSSLKAAHENHASRSNNNMPSDATGTLNNTVVQDELNESDVKPAAAIILSSDNCSDATAIHKHNEPEAVCSEDVQESTEIPVELETELKAESVAAAMVESIFPNTEAAENVTSDVDYGYRTDCDDRDGSIDADADSSSSESVSGGDDDISVEIPVNTCVLQNVIDLRKSFDEPDADVEGSEVDTAGAESLGVRVLGNEEGNNQSSAFTDKVEMLPQREEVLNEDTKMKNLAALETIRSMKMLKKRLSGNISTIEEVLPDDAGISEVGDIGSDFHGISSNHASKQSPESGVDPGNEQDLVLDTTDLQLPSADVLPSEEILPLIRAQTAPIPAQPSLTLAGAELLSTSDRVVDKQPVDGEPKTSRPISAVNPATARKILKNISNSHALEFVNGKYCAKFGPDDMPGLAAWKLASTKNSVRWSLDFSTYSDLKPFDGDDHSHSYLFERRSTLKKSVSIGLVLLTLDCEELLMGTALAFSDGHLEALWTEHIRNFDESADFMAIQYGPQALFDYVNVCGNLHAICKKLEHLLETHFSALGQGHEHFHVEADQTPQKALQRSATVAAIPMQRDDTSGITLDESAIDQPEAVISDQGAVSPVDGAVAAADCSDERNYADDDDDESIIPIYSTALASADDTQPISAPIVHNDAQDAAVVAHDAEKDHEMQPPKHLDVRLTDLYPNIGHIFPSAYNQISNAKSTDNQGARVLLETMHLQAKVYEEWIDVMSDYSTVFSEGRCNMQEHHHNNDESLVSNGQGMRSEASNNATVYRGGTRSLHYRVKSSRPEVRNIILDVFNNELKQWEDLPAGLGLGLSWNVLWTWSKPRIKMSNLLIWQRVNHYPDSRQLTRKDLLKKNISRFTNMSGKAASEFEIMPTTFILPHEYTAFVQHFTAVETMKGMNNTFNYWIMKPIGLSRGRGISIIKDLSEITYSQSSVVQRYVERPLCLHGYKFDLRLYVVVTSFKPLEAFIYKEGFARVSTHQYSLNASDLENKFIHLTNSSIQKLNEEGPTKDNPLSASDADNDTGGSKISLLGAHGLWKRLEAFQLDVTKIWENICLLIIKSLIVVDDKMVNHPCCFELFGYDVLIDSDLRPWLIEVNASPSLARMNALDHRVKNNLIKDIIKLLDPAPFDRAAVVRVLRRRLNGLNRQRPIITRNDPELEKDLKEILGSHVPRQYGEAPREMGQFEQLAPNTGSYSLAMKMKKRIIKS